MSKTAGITAATVAFWQRFAQFNQQQSGGKSASFFDAFLRTHPLDEKRIADLQALLPKAKAEYHPVPQ